MSRQRNGRPLRWAQLPECSDPPEGWRVHSFTKVAKVIAGQSPPSDTYNDRSEGLPFLQGNGDFTAGHPDPALWCSSPIKIAEPGDTLISVRAPVGEVNRSDQRYTIGRGLAALRSTELCTPDFLYQAIQRWRWSLQRVAQGTTFDAITARHFSALRVLVPSDRSEQIAITRLLAAADHVLALVRASIRKARDLERAGVESWFATNNGNAEPLGRHIRDLRYGTSQASNNKGWGHPVLRIPNVVGNRLNLDDLAFVELPPKDVRRLELQTGDLLLVRTNGNPRYVGRSVVFVKPDERTWVYASYLIRARLDAELLPEYVNVFLGTQRGRQELLRRVTTSAGNHNINSNSIRLISVPVPHEIDQQREVVALAARCRRTVDMLVDRERATISLKRAVMDDVLSGRVRVSDAARAEAFA